MKWLIHSHSRPRWGAAVRWCSAETLSRLERGHSHRVTPQYFLVTTMTSYDAKSPPNPGSLGGILT